MTKSIAYRRQVHELLHAAAHGGKLEHFKDRTHEVYKLLSTQIAKIERADDTSPALQEFTRDIYNRLNTGISRFAALTPNDPQMRDSVTEMVADTKQLYRELLDHQRNPEAGHGDNYILTAPERMKFTQTIQKMTAAADNVLGLRHSMKR